jgi:hypothetical protein
MPRTRRARRMKIVSRFERFALPATTIPNNPNTWNWIQTALIGGWGVEGRAGINSAAVVFVAIVSVTVVLFVPGVTVLGEKVQLALAGSPLQLRFTAFENDPPTGEIESE